MLGLAAQIGGFWIHYVFLVACPENCECSWSAVHLFRQQRGPGLPTEEEMVERIWNKDQVPVSCGSDMHSTYFVRTNSVPPQQ